MSVFGIFDSIASMVNNTNTNNSNRAENERNRAFQREMIDQQNQWNSYANQARLMQEAGLNPAVLFGLNSVSGLSQSSVNPPSNIPMQSSRFDSGNIGELFLERKRIQNETLRTQADIEKTALESELYKKALSQADEKFKNEQASIMSNKELSDVKRASELQRIETEKNRTKEVAKNIALLDANITLVKQRASTEKWSQKKMEAEIDNIIKFRDIQIDNIKSSTNLNDSQAVVAKESVEKFRQEVKNLVKSGQSLDLTNYSTMLDNALKEVANKNKMDIEDMKNNFQMMNFIDNECKGVIGDAGNFLMGSFVVPWMESTNSQRNERYKERMNKASSYLFSE